MQKLFFLIAALFLFCHALNGQNPILVDHNCRALSQIPAAWIDSAKNKLFIAYGHTSHGSQLTTGMDALESYYPDGQYDWSHAGGTSELHLFEGAGYDDGYLELDCGRTGWDDETRQYLDDFPECNVMIWSWCGQVNEVDLQSHYLDPMARLEADYPEVTFVYMTGHLEGLGPDGSLFQANQQIRDYCKTHNKVLYDFADIEKYSPAADTNYQEYFADDGLNYDPDGLEPYERTRNWAEIWINKHPDHELTEMSQQCGRCAHSEELNCVLKGMASWWLWARIAGWEGTSATRLPPTPPHEEKRFTVYAISNTLYLASEQPARVRVSIVDMLGRRIYDQNLNLKGTHTLSLDEYGLFIVILQTPHQRFAYQIYLR